MVGVSVVVLAGLLAHLALADHLPTILALALVAIHFPSITCLNMKNSPCFFLMTKYGYTHGIYLVSEALLIFAGFSTVLGKTLHLGTTIFGEAFHVLGRKTVREGGSYENVPPCLQAGISKSNNPVSTCHLTS